MRVTQSQVHPHTCAALRASRTPRGAVGGRGSSASVVHLNTPSWRPTRGVPAVATTTCAASREGADGSEPPKRRSKPSDPGQGPASGSPKSSSAPRKGAPPADGTSRGSGGSKPAGAKTPAPRAKAKAAPAAPPPLPSAAVLVDPATGRLLPCLLRRSVSTHLGPRALLTPLDATCALLRSSGGGEDDEDYTEVEDGSEEMDTVFPVAAAAALRQRGLVLQRCAFALTLRGVLHYTDADVISLDEGVDGSAGGEDGESLGLEVCSFIHAALGAEYLLYSPVDPLVLLAKPAEAGAGAPPVPQGAATAGGIADVAAAIAVAASSNAPGGGAGVPVYYPAFDDVDRADGALKTALDALQAELEALSDV